MGNCPPGGTSRVRVSLAWAALANRRCVCVRACVCVCFLLLCQPWAFPARELLRKKLIGKDVCFSVEYKTSPRREYGMVYLGKGERPSLLRGGGLSLRTPRKPLGEVLSDRGSRAIPLASRLGLSWALAAVLVRTAGKAS